MPHWIFARQAVERLQGTRTGRVNLFEAARASGAEVSIIEWNGREADLEGLDNVSADEVIVYGGHRFLDALAEIRPAWSTGIFHDPDALSSQTVIRELGDMALNHGSRLLPVQEAHALLKEGYRLFLRPDRADKTFAGGVFGKGDAARLEHLSDLEVTVSHVREIIAEYRFVIVQGRVVTGSQYARGGRLDVRLDVDPSCQALAADAAALYAPMDAFICDVAETPDGPRVVEYNSVSAAGMYACDGVEVITAMHRLLEARRNFQPAP